MLRKLFSAGKSLIQSHHIAVVSRPVQLIMTATQSYLTIDELSKDTFTTPALELLNQHNIPYTKRVYQYIPHGGAAASSTALSTSYHWTIKTLIFTIRDNNTLICVLMHGNCNVNTDKLAKQLNVKKISMATEQDAESATGYQVGGCSPFNQKTKIPIYIQQSIVNGHTDTDRYVNDAGRSKPDTVIINGGARGLLIEMRIDDIIQVLQPTQVDVAKVAKSKS